MDYVGLIAKHMSTWMLLLMAVGIAWVLHRWHKSHPNFDLADMITGENGKVSMKKVGVAGAFVVSTWGFIVQVEQGKLTEGYFGLYMAVWCGYRAYVETRKPPQ